ncbi:hypothetical protein FA95DRAFT_956454 [Auriscalpium vulgare]|uniref:Uncharacterized protein n=1 Tax=Auriscalpium vulgare TaxID=40419 RepID=A0ACB8R8K0_9AGAM|nr:hypothetical protein FA95DRAFT_956454 [Auriscalpium vulgare]
MSCYCAVPVRIFPSSRSCNARCRVRSCARIFSVAFSSYTMATSRCRSSPHGWSTPQTTATQQCSMRLCGRNTTSSVSTRPSLDTKRALTPRAPAVPIAQNSAALRVLLDSLPISPAPTQSRRGHPQRRRRGGAQLASWTTLTPQVVVSSQCRSYGRTSARSSWWRA